MQTQSMHDTVLYEGASTLDYRSSTLTHLRNLDCSEERRDLWNEE